MSPTEAVSVYATAGSAEEAERIARTLVEERLAACVNVMPGVTSWYRWEGAVERDAEIVLLAKTRRSLADDVCRRVAELHSAEVPCAVVFPLEGGLPEYLRWLSEQTGPESP